MEEKFINFFGAAGGIIFMLAQVFFAIMPFIMISGNILLKSGLIALNYFIPATSGIFWIWGLVCAISGPQDIFAIIYYIFFGVVWLPYYIATIISLFSRD